MNRSRILACLWSRPCGRTQWGFTMALFLVTLAGVCWLTIHGDIESREALTNWLASLSGETSLRMKTPDYLRGGLMLSALAWTVAGPALWLTRSWWWKPMPSASTKPFRIFDRRFAIGLLLLILLATAIRWPRLGLGLYNDEIDVFRTSIAGSFDNKTFHDVSSDELPEYRSVSWQETVWGNRIGNNHALQSILARIGYDGWKSSAGAPEGVICEWPLRLPALLGGLLSLVGVAALAKLLTGTSQAGWLSAFFIAIHPWHLRYSTEARGYGLLFGFAVLTVLFLVLARQRGQWRWWLAYGASQTAALWSCVGGLHLIFAINAVTAIAFLWPQRGSIGKELLKNVYSGSFPRWFAACLLSALFYLPLGSPGLPPISQALKTNPTFQQGVLPGWEKNTLSYYLTGMPWTDKAPDNPDNPAMSRYTGNPLAMGGLILAIALSLSGMWYLVRRGGYGGCLVVLGPASGVFLQWFASKTGGSSLLSWYANYGTVFVCLWMGVGLAAWIYRPTIRTLPEGSNLRTKAWQRAVIYPALALYLLAVSPALISYRHNSKQKMREAIELIRGGVYPFTEEQRKPLVAGWWTHANFYDPYLRIAYTPESLQEMIDRAKNENRPLYYVLGTRARALAEDPRVVERLEESGDFELSAELPGLEESQFHTMVYRFIDSEKG